MKPTLLYFSAPWCGPCKAASEVIDSIADDFTTLKIDIDASPALAEQYAVKAVPTAIVLRDGVEQHRQMGTIRANKLRAHL